MSQKCVLVHISKAAPMKHFPNFENSQRTKLENSEILGPDNEKV